MKPMITIEFNAKPMIHALNKMRSAFYRASYVLHRTTGASAMESLRLTYGPRYQLGQVAP